MRIKGFTLIELLAVIVILAIIALIAVPIVINIINNSKSNSQKRSIDGYAKAVEHAVADYQLKNNKKVEGKFNTTDGKTLTREDTTLNVNYKGNVVCNRIIVNKDGSIYVGICTVDGTKVDYEVGETTYGMMAENKTHSINFLNTNIDSNYIIQFTIHTDGITIPEGYESIDCSYNHDESVICYWKILSQDSYYNNKYYDMHLASDGEIYTPYDSSYLFYDLGSAFYSNLTKVDLNGINTKYTTNMSYMFNRLGDRHLKELNLGNKFDTSNVTNMEGMFLGTGRNIMKTLNLGDKFDTSKVTNMYLMFDGMTALEELSIGNKFDTSKVTNMSCMFAGLPNLKTLNLGDKFDTSKVTDMSHMFSSTGRENMETLDLGDKFDTSNVIYMQYMFQETGREKMTKLDLGENFDTSNVTDMNCMFKETGYKSMTKLNLGNNFNTSKVSSMNYMFYKTGYNSLKKLDLGKLFVVNQNINSNNLSYENLFEGLGHDSMEELYLWNFDKYVWARYYRRDDIFKDCGTEGVLTKIVVSSDDFKNTLLNESSVPDFWKANDGAIIQVQTP